MRRSCPVDRRSTSLSRLSRSEVAATEAHSPAKFAPTLPIRESLTNIPALPNPACYRNFLIIRGL